MPGTNLVNDKWQTISFTDESVPPSLKMVLTKNINNIRQALKKEYFLTAPAEPNMYVQLSEADLQLNLSLAV